MSGPGITKSSLLESISFQYLKVDINLKYYHAIVVAKNLIISTWIFWQKLVTIKMILK